MPKQTHTFKLAEKALNAALKWADPEFDSVAACDIEIALLQLHINNGMEAEDRERAEQTINHLRLHGRRYNQHRDYGESKARKAA
uniref:hypothetical protein n=1 Tax=Marinobacterium profundum TaxID=1714300 RepID=UPI00082D6377|nr:hypothetical protein [Marinobacterium profundum]